METSTEETAQPDIPMAEASEKPHKEDEFYEDTADFEGEVEEGHDFRYSPGRGGFRGRPWGPGGGASPRFRGRGGFGPGGSMGPPIRRGAGNGSNGPQFYRGGRGGPPRFGNPNFDPSWGPPPMYGPPPMGFGNQMELWVETKTEDGKSYYYHAITRETTWTRPEGPHIKIMSQGEVEAINNGKPPPQSQQQPPQQQPPNMHQQPPNAIGQLQPIPNQSQQTQFHQSAATQKNGSDATEDGVPSGTDNNATNNGPPAADDNNLIGASHQNSTNSEGTHNEGQTHQQPPAHTQPLGHSQPPGHQQQPPHLQQPAPLLSIPPQQVPQQIAPQFTSPPPFVAPQYGMPPPGFGGYPGGPWGMPWQQTQQQPPSHVDQPAKSLIVKPGVIEPQVIARAAEWSEHRAPDGRPYYYHAARGESVWEKPQAIRDLEAARMAAHSGAAPFVPPSQAQPVIPPMQMNSTPGQNQLHQSGGISFDSMGFVIKKDDKSDESAEAKLELKRKQEAERKKKEEEEKVKQQAVKQQDKSRPISSTPIASTPWCVVWTGDGRVFFYNPSTRTSVWERPDELVGRPDVDKAVATPPDQLANSVAVTKDDKPNKKKNAENADPITLKRSESNSSSNEDVPSKKLKTENENENEIEEVTVVPNVAVTKQQPEKKGDIGKEAAMEAEVRAARERALVPLENRVKSFTEMLREKDVSAFSTWEKELHKIVFDPRYLLLTSRERKQVFEKYVKERAEEERREKRNKIKQKRDDFRSLMELANLHGKSPFSEFAQKYGKDDRFKGIEKMRDREGLFNEYILEVRRREKDEKQQKKETVRKDFIAMLREHDDIDRHSRWPDVKKKIDSDSRYRAVESTMLREDYFHEYCKILKDEKRKQKDKDRERKERKEREKRERDGKDKHRDKDKSKDGKDKDKDKDKEKEKEKDKEKKRDSKHDRSHSRDRHDKSSRKDSERDDQEDGEHPPTSEDESERLQRERERQQRAEHSIKEREKEVQQQLAGHLRERDKERAHHRRDEAIRHFSALLADLVRNPDLTWKEVKKQLRKDHRWESVEDLDRELREGLFNDHIAQLTSKKRDKFREMLDELPNFDLIVSWKDVKKQVRDDPRYLKYNTSEKCEREFRDYIRDKTSVAKLAFKQLLQECKLITHKSFDSVKENSVHLKEIEDILKNDKRYLILEHIETERSQILMTHLEELHKRGPPPPPTASECTRRK